jgi:hypothetical protein
LRYFALWIKRFSVREGYPPVGGEPGLKTEILLVAKKTAPGRASDRHATELGAPRLPG